ncbi:hypothetical protein [Rheinheimera sp.]|jgi:hypothetical protein|uniref:hypothetical protein n=1 Tax=Rheinheimera sp. TaxID=1869214 RepID=UPI003D2A3150
MDIWFSLILLAASQIILCWYSYQLAIEKGYPALLFAGAGLLPLLNLIALMLLLLLPDRRLAEHQLYFSKFRQRP